MKHTEYKTLTEIVRKQMEQNLGNRLTDALATGIMNVILAEAGELVEQEVQPDGESDRTTE
jgi:hypothetical protein